MAIEGIREERRVLSPHSEDAVQNCWGRCWSSFSSKTNLRITGCVAAVILIVSIILFEAFKENENASIAIGVIGGTSFCVAIGTCASSVDLEEDPSEVENEV